MYILAVDTSNNICTVALNDNENNIDLLIENTPSKQAEKLVTMIEQIMARNKISYDDIELFSTSIGPGSFTGVRIGISAIKGIELTTNKESSGVSNLQAQAYLGNIESGNPEVISCMNAMRNQLFLQSFIFEKDIPVATTEPEMIFIDNLEDYLNKHNNSKNKYLALNCNELIPGQILDNYNHSKNILTNAKDIADLAFSFKKHNKEAKVSPLYIRPPDAKKANVKN